MEINLRGGIIVPFSQKSKLRRAIHTFNPLYRIKSLFQFSLRRVITAHLDFKTVTQQFYGYILTFQHATTFPLQALQAQKGEVVEQIEGG